MKAQTFISWNMVHGFDKILTTRNPVHTAHYQQQLTRTHCMELGIGSLAICNTENGTRHRELVTTHCDRTGAHIVERCTNYSLLAACNEVLIAWETRHLKPPTTQNKKQGTHYTARIWKGLLVLALHLPSSCSPDLLCSATTPKKTSDLHSADPQTHHLLAE